MELTTGTLRSMPLRDAVRAFNADHEREQYAQSVRHTARLQWLTQWDAQIRRCPICPAATACVFLAAGELEAHQTSAHRWDEAT